MQERENILNILEGTKEAIKKGNSAKIKQLSNQTTNTAALTNDPDNIAIAVVVYSISKLIERPNYQSLPGWDEFYKTIFKCVDNAIQAIKKGDEKEIKESISSLRNSLIQVSGSLKVYIQDIFRKASINKASNLYEHGLSMERTAKLLGITMFELANYIGQKQTLSEIPLSMGVNVQSRIKLAMDIFK